MEWKKYLKKKKTQSSCLKGRKQFLFLNKYIFFLTKKKSPKKKKEKVVPFKQLMHTHAITF
jgi:hypothetical protein